MFKIYICLFHTDLVSSKIYDKQYESNFNSDFKLSFFAYFFLLFFVGDVPCFISYGVNISQPICFARVSSHVTDFNDRYFILLLNFSNRTIGIINFKKGLQFYRQQYELVSKFEVRLKPLLQHSLSEPDVMLIWSGSSKQNVTKIINKSSAERGNIRPCRFLVRKEILHY